MPAPTTSTTRTTPGTTRPRCSGSPTRSSAAPSCVALLPGDCPLVEGFELDRELEAQAPGVAVIPDHHGDGTNGLILAPPDVISPSFGPGSRTRHHRLAREAGVRCRVATIPSLALDLDTADDLDALRAALAADPKRAPATDAVLAALGDEPR